MLLIKEFNLFNQLKQNLMKIKFLGILLVSGLVALTSCTKDAMMSDTELIHAIQKASKQEVDATQLPGSANAVLSEQFADYYNARTLVASELGYEAQMTEGERPDEGFEGDFSDDRRESYMYFDLDGRPLGERPDDGSEDGDRPDDGDDDRPDDGSEEDGDEDRPEEADDTDRG
ncbi:MAG: hypothetical protein O2990_08835 [Bacteroidetes bacterium]|nr:hypothetical protein [Bacteroidota bacterium]